MKKLLSLTLLSILFLSMTACGLLTTSAPTVTTATDILTTSTTTTSALETTTTLPSTDPNEPFIPTGYSLLQDELEYVGIPSIGDVKILVFAVDFSDQPALGSGVTIQDIETAFNGPSDQTSFESLKSYYAKSSYGKLNLSADIYGYYRALNTSEYYETEYDKLYAWNDYTDDYLYSEDEVTYVDSDLITELLAYYDNQIDYSDYDYNNDGYIDGIYIIYTTPVSYNYGSDLWWAYQDYYAYSGDVFDQVEANYFCWSGTDFFLEGTGGINARTIIHETGHMLGLDDYYDYSTEDTFNSGGLGGADMMDNTVGDHNPASKLLLGWVVPLIVTESMSINLLPFAESGQVILLMDEWRGTIFDEYLLVSYYTPTNLNYKDRADIFSVSGVLIYHVDARIDAGYNEESYYYTLFNFNNTDTAHKFIDIIEADAGNDIDKYGDAENTDLFQTGDIFKDTVYRYYSWFQVTRSMDFTIEVAIKTADQVAVIFTFK